MANIFRNLEIAQYFIDNLSLLYLKQHGVELIGCEIFQGVESALIIGAGSSADPNIISEIATNYEVSITINSAMHLFPQATWHSFELYFAEDKIQDQLNWITQDNYQKILFKPYSLRRQSRKALHSIYSHYRSITKSSSSYKPKSIKHRQLRTSPNDRNYLRIIRKKRLPIQYRGSFSLLLDMVYLSNIKRIGLIGVDQGGPYASSIQNNLSEELLSPKYSQSINNPTPNHRYNPLTSTIQINNIDLTAQGGRPAFLDTLSFLYKKGYLNEVSFNHYHNSKRLEEILSDS